MDKKYAIKGTKKETGEVVYWQNCGVFIVWKPAHEHWVFDKWMAEEIASRMKCEDVENIHVVEAGQ